MDVYADLGERGMDGWEAVMKLYIVLHVLHDAGRWDRVAASVPSQFLQRQQSTEAITLALQRYQSRVDGIQVGAGRALRWYHGCWEPAGRAVTVARIQGGGEN